MVVEAFLEFTQTALWQFIVVNLGVGGVLTGIVGLAMGGTLPGIRVPYPLRGFARIFFAISLMIGLTLVTAAPPNLLESVIKELTS